MKIWTFFASIFLGTIIFGCSTSNDMHQEASSDMVFSNYEILLKGSSGYYAKNITSGIEGLSLNSTNSLFPGFSTSSVSYKDKSKLILYQRTDDCGGKLLSYDFNENIEHSLTVFTDLSSCVLTVTAIVQKEHMVFLSYYLDIAGKQHSFYVRSIDLNSRTFTDFELNKKPIQLAVSHNRLFVLTWDENLTNKHTLTVLDISKNTELHEMDLDMNVSSIFVKNDGDIIISYPDLHTTLDSNTLNKSYTKYLSGSEPYFPSSQNVTFTEAGYMYYVRESVLEGKTKGIAAMHNFKANSTVLYYFENFLNETQLNVAFNVEKATTIGYDNLNDLIIIGYKKNGSNEGGVMRITPAPNLTFVDNLNLEDIPYYIFLNN